MTLREQLLSRPAVYRTWKRLVLPDGVLERLVEQHFIAADGARVLDLGCGFGDYAPLYAGRCDYLGIDHNAPYIETAKRLNSSTSARFLVADVEDQIVADNGPFDLIFMSGVLHHLPSASVERLGSMVAPLLTKGGRFVAFEPVFDPQQGLTARLIIASDRGRFVRDEEGYRSLLSNSFTRIDTTVKNGLLRMPYTHVILSAFN